MRAGKPRLVFVSPVFLFPNDAGGKIRTTNILRTLKGGAFELVLVSVATREQVEQWQDAITGVCDEFVFWPAARAKPRWQRAFDLLRELPISVVADKSNAGLRTVAQAVTSSANDLVVFDFVHSAVLLPSALQCPSICFTHNVEAEIFARHAKQASSLLHRSIWKSQYKKMERFEASALQQFNGVIAVSERDAGQFRQLYKIKNIHPIPTGVDLSFFTWQQPLTPNQDRLPTVVFTGSMDWAANIDGVRFFLENVWPNVVSSVPKAQFVVVGKAPPVHLVQSAAKFNNVRFTGFVDDVRPYVHAAHAFVIPLLVGGGTRIKAFEAMAMGCPIVSTSIGMEGLDAEEGVYYMKSDTATSMADAVIALLSDQVLRDRISIASRQMVESQFGHEVAGKAFEAICLSYALKAP